MPSMLLPEGREPVFGHVSGGEIVLLAVGAVLTVALVILFITLIVRANRQERESKDE